MEIDKITERKDAKGSKTMGNQRKKIKDKKERKNKKSRGKEEKKTIKDKTAIDGNIM